MPNAAATPYVVAPTQAQVDALVAPYLAAQSKGLGFAIGYASPTIPDSGGLLFAGNIQNQVGAELALGKGTLFEIASITKTFTAILYALLIRADRPKLTIGDFIAHGLPISTKLAKIRLDQLVNYTSGLPSDYEDSVATTVSPFLRPQPYSMAAMLSWLQLRPPEVSSEEDAYTYSNLAFAIMSAILAVEGMQGQPAIGAFLGKMRKNIFEPLGLQSKFFDEISLADLPVGYNYDGRLPGYSAAQPGHPFFPAILGSAGIVATPDDMLKWMLFNMGITKDSRLTPLLRTVQTPSTTATARDGDQLGLGWFITPANIRGPGLVNKDGDLDGFGAYMGLLLSPDPGVVPSRAGAFVLVNAHDLKGDNPDIQIAETLTKKVLNIMHGQAFT